jgi:ZIP family zinc transporter
MQIFDYIENVFPIIFALIGGIMVFVAIHQLLPSAQKFAKHETVMKWLFLGMAFMAASLIILEFVV